jgi:hypothetical protein
MDFSKIASLSSPWGRLSHTTVVEEGSAGHTVIARRDCLLLSFPLELKVKILSLLEPGDLMSLRLVCKEFLHTATHDDVWRHHSEEIDTRKGGPLQPPIGQPVWSFMLLYWTRKTKPTQPKTLQQMVDEWTIGSKPQV